MLLKDNCLSVRSADQMKKWDDFTICSEPVSSILLMERASSKCVNWFLTHFPESNNFFVFCGAGNNGGDGLAIARLLEVAGKKCSVFLCGSISEASPDNAFNWNRFYGDKTILSEGIWPNIPDDAVIIDALFGTGLNRPVTGFAADCIRFINSRPNITVAIDLPSGLLSDAANDPSNAIVKASFTLTFQSPKLTLLFPESEPFCGQWLVLDIGLANDFLPSIPDSKFFLNPSSVKSLIRQSSKFDHKGKNGHALLVAGAESKYGAAVLATRAALRSGTGLLTVHVPHDAELIFQTACPEAMLSLDENENCISAVPLIDKYSSIGVGPGIGTLPESALALKDLLLSAKQNIVLDADALNILAANKDWLSLLPSNTIITPHLKEFERLAGKSENDFQRHQIQIDFSVKYKVFVLLKGAYSCLSTPDGHCYFNCSGNPGMAKGGSGDVLTGIITALLAQQYSACHAAVIGMYVHGLAGDLAAEKLGTISMNASDIIDCLPEAFLTLI